MTHSESLFGDKRILQVFSPHKKNKTHMLVTIKMGCNKEGEIVRIVQIK